MHGWIRTFCAVDKRVTFDQYAFLLVYAIQFFSVKSNLSTKQNEEQEEGQQENGLSCGERCQGLAD